MSRSPDTKLAISIGQSARRARELLKLTRKDVAEQLDRTESYYGRIERGVALPSVSTLDRMSTVLCVSTDALLGRISPDQAEATQRPPERQPSWSDRPDIRRLLRHVQLADPRTVRFVTRMVIGIERARRARGSSPDEPPPHDAGRTPMKTPNP